MWHQWYDGCALLTVSSALNDAQQCLFLLHTLNSRVAKCFSRNTFLCLEIQSFYFSLNRKKYIIVGIDWRWCSLYSLNSLLVQLLTPVVLKLIDFFFLLFHF